MKKLAWLPVVFATMFGCVPARAPTPSPSMSPEDTVGDLKSKTVALVQVQNELETLLNGGPNVRPFCTGVWVSQTSILTAKHCTEDIEPDMLLDVVTESDVFAPDSFMPKAFVTTRKAELYAVDEDHDLALLRVKVLPPRHGTAQVTTLGVVAGVRAQQVGHSIGLWWSYSSGDVAAIRQLDTGYISCLLVQATTPTSPGNSGGGLYNLDGQLIGIAHAAATRGQNLNFFVHPKYIQSFLARELHQN